MSGGPYIPENLLLRWVQLLKKKRFYGKTIINWENGEVFMIEQEQSMRKEQIEEFLKKP